MLGVYQLVVITGMPLAAEKIFSPFRIAASLSSGGHLLFTEGWRGGGIFTETGRKMAALSLHYKYRPASSRGQVVSGGWRGHGAQLGRIGRGTALVWVRCQALLSDQDRTLTSTMGHLEGTGPCGIFLAPSHRNTRAYMRGMNANGPSPVGFHCAFRRRNNNVAQVC